MAIQAINIAEVNSANKNKKNSNNASKNAQPSFQGLADVPVALATALDNGGFITSFIAQDFFGMAGPRILEGINRRPVNPETGKKEGPYNWTFARREGIREILSGPSAFIIPMFILHFVTKHSGKANNVPINLIQGFGNNFIDYASANQATLNDIAKTRPEYYQSVFKNVLHTTLEGKLSQEELETLSKDFAQKAIGIEEAKAPDYKIKKSFFKKLADVRVEGSAEDLTNDLLKKFMDLKKKHLGASTNELVAQMTIKPENYGKAVSELAEGDTTTTTFKKLLSSLSDFSDDVINSTGEALEKYKDKEFDPQRFLKTFVDRRTGSRIITNLGMWGAVVGFYALIPKLYSLGLKGQNPAFATEKKLAEEKEQAAQLKGKNVSMTGTAKDSADIAFTGKHQMFVNTAEKVLESNKLKKAINLFEFDDASMSVWAMTALLFGFCLPTRLLNAPDKYDRRETITRDITSFASILFAAEALSKGFSNTFAKFSGLALNVKPADHNDGIMKKFKNYFSPTGGINVLSNKQLESKYINIEGYKDGINGFFEFVSDNGGNLKKMLTIDKGVAQNVEVVLGKPLKDATNEEIQNAFKNIGEADTEKLNARKNIINIFSDSKNKFVKRAKFYNSMFKFLSTIVFVPLFMVWLARTCDKMTRKARALDGTLKNSQQAQGNADTVDFGNTSNKITQDNVRYAHPNRITMQGFLAK